MKQSTTKRWTRKLPKIPIVYRTVAADHQSLFIQFDRVFPFWPQIISNVIGSQPFEDGLISQYDARIHNGTMNKEVADHSNNLP
jgi:hypothetical protein